MSRLVVPEPSADRLTFVGVSEICGPDGEIVALNMIVPERLVLSVTVMASNCSEPGWALRVDWSVFSVKSGWAGE